MSTPTPSGPETAAGLAELLRDDVEALRGVASAVVAVAGDIPRVMDVDPTIVWGPQWVAACSIIVQIQTLAIKIDQTIFDLRGRGPISSSGIPGDAMLPGHSRGSRERPFA